VKSLRPTLPTVPVLAKNTCRTGRLWGHARDDRPFGGKAAPAVVLYYSPNREGVHPQRQLAKYTGIMQVDAYSGYNALYVAGRRPGPIIERHAGRTGDASCSIWHA